ncbi:MAG: hypothetical protein JXB13_18725 [Phycisphaerae bacterium]|nr:hypothetical protein [Phycisphaerae bacterium]
MKPRFVYKRMFYENRRYGYPAAPMCVWCPHCRGEQIRRDRSRYRSWRGGFYPVRRFCVLASVLRSARKPRELPRRIRWSARSAGERSPQWCPRRAIERAAASERWE